MSLFDAALLRFNVLSIDTEFPGFLHNTPRDAPPAVRYDDLKYNVDNTKIIQLGITLSDDEGNIGDTWEFNFSEFDVEKDAYVEESIQLMKNNGVNFEKIRSDGIGRGVFPNAEGFAECATKYFESVFDIKVVAKYCQGLLGGNLGLSKLAKILDVKRSGEAHNAGSDSLVTAAVFAKIKECYEVEEEYFEGILYGMEARIKRRQAEIIVERYCQQLNPQHPSCPPPRFEDYCCPPFPSCPYNYSVPIPSNVFVMM
ncbi:Ribonuclease CAF1 [Melia azedarach]|uniref:Ribonuclease CAF1 n=1 Tax=Melia azedarach TaxID=155640 RepID=A0ACC1X6F7_MELAZ|nr:Ribonuclease CAF1 [Melia azedarach]